MTVDPEQTLPRLTWAVVLDAALATAAYCLPDPPVPRLPAHLAEAALTGRPPADALVGVRVGATRRDTVDVHVTEVGGRARARLRGLRFAAPGQQTAPAAARSSLRPRRPSRPGRRARRRPVRTRLASPGVGRARRPARSVVLVGADPRCGRRWPGTSRGRACAWRACGTRARRSRLRPGSPRPTWCWSPRRRTPGPARGSRGLPLPAAGRHRAADGGGPPGGAAAPVVPDARGPRGARRRGAGPDPAVGLAAVAAAEHPRLWCGTVDLPTAPRRPISPRWHGCCGRPRRGGDRRTGGAATAARPARPPARPGPGLPGGRHVPGHRRARGRGPVRGPRTGRPGARRLVLTARTPLPPRADWDTVRDPAAARRVAAVRALEAAGRPYGPWPPTPPTPGGCVSCWPRRARPAAGARVVHAAGAREHRPPRALDRRTLRAVLRPRTGGAMVLHQLFPPGSVDFFVLLTSADRPPRTPGRAADAAADAFLDGLAAHRGAADGG
ncbi:KR domain-containing protein [Streptomyces sp. M19]